MACRQLYKSLTSGSVSHVIQARTLNMYNVTACRAVCKSYNKSITALLRVGQYGGIYIQLSASVLSLAALGPILPASN